MVMLDTSICIYIIKQKPPAVFEHLSEYQVGDIQAAVAGRIASSARL
jgi:predicted nucleic acid-binding protein